MSGILLVERSTTLNHLLRRTLDAAGLPVRAEIGNYLEALDPVAYTHLDVYKRQRCRRARNLNPAGDCYWGWPTRRWPVRRASVDRLRHETKWSCCRFGRGQLFPCDHRRGHGLSLIHISIRAFGEGGHGLLYSGELFAHFDKHFPIVRFPR